MVEFLRYGRLAFFRALQASSRVRIPLNTLLAGKPYSLRVLGSLGHRNVPDNNLHQLVGGDQWQ